MFAAKISFMPSSNADIDLVEASLVSLYNAFINNGQIIGDCVSYWRDDRYEWLIYVPAEDALNNDLFNIYAHKAVSNLHKNGELKFAMLGRDYELSEGPYPQEKTPPFYILWTNYTQYSSPVRSGDTFQPVPLYRLPPTYEADPSYYDIVSWQTYYRACDKLQMGCTVGERFNLNQMSRIDSALTKQGRDVCAKIEAKTTIPTYYYLYNYAKRSLAADTARKCPGCNGEWKLGERLFGEFDFKCDPCRLLSNITLHS